MGSKRMVSPMKFLNSLGEISPRPLKRVISDLDPSFFIASTLSDSE